MDTVRQELCYLKKPKRSSIIIFPAIMEGEVIEKELLFPTALETTPVLLISIKDQAEP